MYGRAIVIAGVTAIAFASATTFAGASAQVDGVIVGCQKPGKGFRVVQEASDCRRKERVVTWNERGPAGPGRVLQGLRARRAPWGRRGRRVTRLCRGERTRGPDRLCGASRRRWPSGVQPGPPERRVPLVPRAQQEPPPSGALDGTGCTRFDSAAGTVDVVVTSANLIELRCVAGGTPPRLRRLRRRRRS